MLKVIGNIVNSPLVDMKDCTKSKANAYGIIINHQIKFVGTAGIISLLILAALYKKEQMIIKHEETMAKIELEKIKLTNNSERDDEYEEKEGN